jgi:hypothetical protein
MFFIAGTLLDLNGALPKWPWGTGPTGDTAPAVSRNRDGTRRVGVSFRGSLATARRIGLRRSCSQRVYGQGCSFSPCTSLVIPQFELLERRVARVAVGDSSSAFEGRL